MLTSPLTSRRLIQKDQLISSPVTKGSKPACLKEGIALAGNSPHMLARPAKAVQSPPDGALINNEIILVKEHVYQLVQVRHRPLLQVCKQLLFHPLANDSGTTRRADSWNKDSTILNPVRPHLLDRPHAHMVWTGNDDIVTVALLKLFLYKGPNRVWHWRWHCSSDDEGGF